MDFPTLLLIGAFVVIVITALALLSTVGPVSLEGDKPSSFESRLSKSRLQKGALAATAVGAGVAGASLASAQQDPRKKKDEGGSSCGGEAALMPVGGDTGSDSGSDGGSSCGGGGCGD